MVHDLEVVILSWISVTALVIEMLAVIIIVVAIFWGLAQYLRHARFTGHLIEARFTAYRTTLGRALLLGLEILVAADIIKTVALETTLESVVVLGLLVISRIFLGWSLIVELEGRWPWQKKAGSTNSPQEDLN